MTERYVIGAKPGDDYPERIKRLRVEIGLTQQAPAERLGVSFATVNRWENKQTKPSRLYWNQLQQLEMRVAEESVPYGKPVATPPAILDFTAQSEVVKALAEGECLSFGHLMNPAFGAEISSIDPLPHQRIAVYYHMLKQPRLRFLLADDAGARMITPSIRPRHAVAQLKPGVAMPRRKNIRMQGWDFTSPGWYFITICTKNMRPAFGTVVNGHMILNQAGILADQCLREIPAHFPRAVVDEHVVMPNHVHGLLRLVDRATTCRGPMEAFGKPVAGSVPTIVRSYKAAVSRALGENFWQGRFYEVRARDDAARANIRRYIRDNPRNFDAVMNCGEPQFMGNKALLEMPKLGFLASRGRNALHGSLPLKPGEAIMSGFLSPMERAVFRAGLARKRPMIWVKPWGLAVNGNTACRVAIEAGRLLLLSPFDAAIEAPSARRAVWCNQYVLAHCDRTVVGHLNPYGMLACILAEADPEKEIVQL